MNQQPCQWQSSSASSWIEEFIVLLEINICSRSQHLLIDISFAIAFFLHAEIVLLPIRYINGIQYERYATVATSSWICDSSVLRSRHEWLAIHTWSAAAQPWTLGSCMFMQALPTSTNKFGLTISYVCSVGWFHVAILIVVEAWLKLKHIVPTKHAKWIQTDRQTVFAGLSQVPAAVLRWSWGKACWFHPSSSTCPCASSSSKKWFLWWDLPVSTPQPLFKTATFGEGQCLR